MDPKTSYNEVPVYYYNYFSCTDIAAKSSQHRKSPAVRSSSFDSELQFQNPCP